MVRTMTILLGLLAVLVLSDPSFALTLDEAKTNAEREAVQRQWTEQDRTQAVNILQGLVEKGVPAEHAYAVVGVCMNQGIKGKDLAAIARSIEAGGTGGRGEGAMVAANAVRNRYTVRETEQFMETYRNCLKDGAPPEDAVRMMTRAMERKMNAGSVIRATEQYTREIKTGTPSAAALENATKAMDQTRERTRDRKMDGTGDRERDLDRDRDRLREHQPSGAGRSPGSSPGMGGGRR